MTATAGRRGLRIETLGDVEALRALHKQWLALWQASAPRHVFTHPGWQIAAARAYADRRAPCVLVARDGDAITGILPLVKDGGRLRFLGAPWADYNDLLLAADADADRVIGAFLAEIARRGGALLENLREDAHLARLRDRSEFSGVRLRSRFRSQCPTVIAPGDELEQLARKKSLVRHEKKLQKLGGFALRALDDQATVASLLPVFFEQHSRRRAFTGEGIVFADPAARAFVAALFDELPRGSALLHVVECAGKPAAMHLGFESDGAFLWYKPTFDVDLWNLGPGEVLMRQLMLDAKRRGLREFDFTIGEEDFKYRFANHAREAFEVQVMPRGVRGAIRACRADLRSAIDRRPRLKQMLKTRLVPALRRASELRRGRLRDGALRARAMPLWSDAPCERVLLRAPSGATLDARVRPVAMHELADAALAAPRDWPAERMTAARKLAGRGQACGWFGDDRLLHLAVVEDGPPAHLVVLAEATPPKDPTGLMALLCHLAGSRGVPLACDPRDRVTLEAARTAGFVHEGTLAAPAPAAAIPAEGD